MILISVVIASLAFYPSGQSSYYKLNRYYDNIYAQGAPSSTVLLKSGQCYTFPLWFGKPAFNGGWKVTCYDSIQQDTYGTYQISGEFQTEFADNDGPLSYTCSAPTVTNSYSVYMPSKIYDTEPTMYAVYYYDSTTQTIVQQFGSASFECFEATLPPDPSGCPFSSDISRRRLDSTSAYHIASFNVSVEFLLGTGASPQEWMLTLFYANNFSSPWTAMNNDVIVYLRNLGKSTGDRCRRLSSECSAWGDICAGGQGFHSRGRLNAADSSYGVSFTLECVEGVLSLASHSLESGSANSILTEPANFSLSFNYQVSTTLDYETAHLLFVDAIETKLNTSILDGFPTFAMSLSYNDSAPYNMTVSDVYVPFYTTDSIGKARISATDIIVIVCVVGGALLLAVFVCLRRHCQSPSSVHPADVEDESKLYV